VPQLHVYLANEDPNTPFIIICPGGGYHILAWDLEGTEIATWLQSIGVNAGVLKYRVPSAGEPIKHQAPVQDAQRAISLVREKYATGESKIGLLGFSAGGYTVIRTAAATTSLYGETASPAPKADFCVLIYPAYLVNKENGEFTKDFEVTKKFPPSFFAHAADDVHVSAGSVQLHQRLIDAGTPSELHVFATGGHGFGGRVAGSPTDAWRSLCETWMRSQSILTNQK
jgi:acetyl esterase/lipase